MATKIPTNDISNNKFSIGAPKKLLSLREPRLDDDDFPEHDLLIEAFYDDAKIAVADQNKIEVWSANGNWRLFNFVHDSTITAITERDSYRLYFADHRGRLYEWDFSISSSSTSENDSVVRLICTIPSASDYYSIPTSKIKRVSGDVIVTVRGWRLMLWNATTGALVQLLQYADTTHAVGDICVLQDSCIVAASTDGMIRVWRKSDDSTSNNKSKSAEYHLDLVLRGHKHFVIRLTALQCGMIASICQDRTFRLWSIEDENPHRGQCVFECTVTRAMGHSSSFEIEDGILFISAGKVILVYSLREKRWLNEYKHSSQIEWIRKRKDGSILIKSKDLFVAKTWIG